MAFETALQDESLRLACLEAMGIDVWVPQRPLPGAAPSLYFFWPWQAGKEAQPAPPLRDQAPQRAMQVLEQAVPAITAAPSEALAALAEVSEAPPARAEVTPPRPASQAEVQSHPHADPEAVPRFQLAWVRLGSLLLVADVPLQRPQLNPDALSLASNIAQAVQGRGLDALPFQYFRWPQVKIRGVDQSQTMATRTLRLLLGKQQAAGILLLGSQACWHLLQQEVSEADFAQLQQLPGLPPIACSYSLEALLRVPALKRDAWQQLQPLCQALRSAASH